MIKLENTEVLGWEHAIRGMRNPMNSWKNGDSETCNPLTNCIYGCSKDECEVREHFHLGSNDHDLMMRLANGGPVHAKYRRMIAVYVDITAPLYWWKEFDTYKVGTVANSCSTMHKIADKEFTLEDFSCEHLMDNEGDVIYNAEWFSPKNILESTIYILNWCRQKYLETKDKRYWWQMIQLLPSSYNQRRTVMLNYEVLANIYKSRKGHKLDEWSVDFMDWIASLPYSELIIGNGRVLDDISQIPICHEIMEEAKRRVREEMAAEWNGTPGMSANDFLGKELNIGRPAIELHPEGFCDWKARLLKDNPYIQKEIYDYFRDLDPKAFDRVNAMSAEELQAALDLQAKTSILETSDNPDISQISKGE